MKAKKVIKGFCCKFWRSKAGVMVTTSVKIVIVVVLGAALLAGTAAIVVGTQPTVRSKIENMFDTQPTTVTPETVIPTFATTTALIDGAIEVAGDYRYTYSESAHGWSAVVVDVGKSAYEPMLTMLRGAPIVSAEGCYKDCASLVSAPTIPAGLTNTDEMFRNCTSLRSASLPEGLTTIGSYAFSDCVELTTVLPLPDSLRFIGHASFMNCMKMEGELVFPSGLEVIREWAFDHCSSLSNTSINIPASVTEIGFEGLDYSTHTFYDCATKTLRAFTVDAENTNFKTIDGVLFNAAGTRLLSYPPNKPDVTYAIPDGTTHVDTMAFSRTGNAVFSGTPTAFKTLSLPNSLVISNVGNFAATTGMDSFYYQNPPDAWLYRFTGVETFVVRDDNPHVTVVDGVLYSKDMRILYKVPTCYGHALVIPDSVEEIREGAFNGANISSLTIPASVKIIGMDDQIKELQYVERVHIDEGNPTFYSSSNEVNASNLRIIPKTLSTEVTSVCTSASVINAAGKQVGDIRFLANYNIPDGYTFQEAGIVYAPSSVFTYSQLVAGTNGSMNAVKIRNKIDENNVDSLRRTNLVTVTLQSVAVGKGRLAISYLTVTDTGGNTMTVYSSRAISGMVTAN